MAEDKTGPCGNDDVILGCLKCYPRVIWKISEHRIQHIVYERQILANTPEEALKIFREGTSWPHSYDEIQGQIVQQDDPVVERVEPRKSDYLHRCWHELDEARTKFESKGVDDL